ncbi:50S ribosomal protein L11 methyltransferase [Tahibacter amnicola]|uniref:50S ribosomal protein L11 methyltransferase n=1 Tax=Tahibacter amnicola TaxID=2976241 RepID=A0ABY6BDE3_9GAMM|nr:50S ribosomal protein L11 methyltransferase [Tahibacter amnicola]UXI65937.1 50S ribosomal protein L11 methyltransferase [Tahibacter amnicola]
MMSDWQEPLLRALASGDTAQMQAALRRVPANVLHMAVPAIAQMADLCDRDGRLDEAVTYLNQLAELQPDEARWRQQRASVNLKRGEAEAVLADAEWIVALRPDDVDGHRLLAAAHDTLRNGREALAAYRRVRELAPGDTHATGQIDRLDGELRKEELLQRVLDPQAAPVTPDAPAPLPRVEFDPQLFADPAVPTSTNPAMVAGLRQHLARYGAHLSSRATLERLDDPQWLQAWDSALAATAGGRVLLHGSELGLFALRALAHGAVHVTIVEESAIDARIAAGIVQKHLLAAWHAQHGPAIHDWSDEQRQASFEAFASHVDVVPADAQGLPLSTYDWLVIPDIDHSLLGSGIVRTIRSYRERGATKARVLPEKARLHAMGVQWAYPGTELDLGALAALRWSPYPQPVELSEDCWIGLTAPTEIGEVDFNTFADARWPHHLPVVKSGTLNAMLFWFDIEIAGARLSTAPGNRMRCIRPAVQYTDPIALETGGLLDVDVVVEATRLFFETVPPARTMRACALPSWYVPMIVDVPRNAAYRDALAARLAERNGASVLDIGAGCGLLSVMAAQLGASRVHGCEVDGPLADVAEQVALANGVGDRVRIVRMDSRRMRVPEDMPAPAELAVFELFDCSLIGEGVLHFLTHAREHLLAPNALLVPMAGRIRGMVIEYRLDRIWDIDANILNPYRFSPEFINVDARELAYRPLSEPFDVFAFDFATATPAPEEREIDVEAIERGTAGALLFWFDLQLAPDRWLSNAPDAPHRLHWKQALQFLPEVQVEAGRGFPITARHNGSAMAFRWRQNALPAQAYSRLPRFDARVYQQVTELQSQTADLFRHCAADPAEYLRVAALAQRFAIDPAAHGLDPRIAQRFCAHFFANGR